MMRQSIEGLLQADAAAIPLSNESVHCVIISPPYWNLREYKGEQSRGKFPNLGNEPAVEEYIYNLCVIAEEIYRVLRADGVFWLNLGDCYLDKRLVGVPHRVAFAIDKETLFILRDDRVWSKPNPTPDSVGGWRFEQDTCECWNSGWEEAKAAREELGVTRVSAGLRAGIAERGADLQCPKCSGTGYLETHTLRKGNWRTTRAHENLFMFVKGFPYYTDQRAIREKNGREADIGQYRRADGHIAPGGDLKKGKNSGFGGKKDTVTHPDGKNPLSVMTVNTERSGYEHFAAFPQKLIAPLIMGNVPKKCCPECGTGYANVEFTNNYLPACSCECDEPPVPGLVLDSFVGTGTTGKVARALGRSWIGLDISRKYLDEQAKPKALKLTPHNALDNLPLFWKQNNLTTK